MFFARSSKIRLILWISGGLEFGHAQQVQCGDHILTGGVSSLDASVTAFAKATGGFDQPKISPMRLRMRWLTAWAAFTTMLMWSRLATSAGCASTAIPRQVHRLREKPVGHLVGQKPLLVLRKNRSVQYLLVEPQIDEPAKHQVGSATGRSVGGQSAH